MQIHRLTESAQPSWPVRPSADAAPGIALRDRVDVDETSSLVAEWVLRLQAMREDGTVASGPARRDARQVWLETAAALLEADLR